MPYIPEDRRQHYESALNHLANLLDMRDYEPGDVTYVIYSLMMRNVKGICAGLRAPTFTRRTRAEANCLAAAKEFRRRHIDPYEDDKLIMNGDIV
jgi:hypothetical protein